MDEEHNDGEDKDDAPDEHRPVHAGGRNLLVDGEEAHDERKGDVQQRDDVARDGEAAETPAGRWERLPTDALKKNAADGDEVRREEGGDEERDDGVEGRGAADVDNGENDGDA